MKAKLIKKNEHYFLETQPYTLSNLQRHTIIANTFDKPKGHILQLSLKNCQAIECGYDLEDLAEDMLKSHKDFEGEGFSDYQNGRLNGIYEGFQKALAILGDKKFNEVDMINFSEFVSGKYINQYKFLRDKSLKGFFSTDEILKEYQSLQQTEWDVEIDEEMEFIFDPAMGITQGYYLDKPKLDTEGCLILKRL